MTVCSEYKPQFCLHFYTYCKAVRATAIGLSVLLICLNALFDSVKRVGTAAAILTYSMERSPSWESNRFSARQKFSAFNGTWRFITAFTSARHLSLSWARSIQFMPHIPLPDDPSFHLNLGLPSGFFPSVFPTKTLYTPLLSPIRATCPANIIILDIITRKILDKKYRLLSFSKCSFFPHPCYLFPLRPKYSPQHPILKHPQPTFLPQSYRPSFTPIQNNKQNYNYVNLNR